MEYIHDRVPFPVFRLIIDYMEVIPRLHPNAHRSLQLHFQEKYCKRCGEYITARKYHSRKLYHFGCRQFRYVPDAENTKYFHFHKASLFELMYGLDGDWRTNIEKIPILYYSKQPINYYRMDICEDPASIIVRRAGVWVDFMYETNIYVTSPKYNDKFTVIPELFSKYLYANYRRPFITGIHDIMSGITKLDVMKRFTCHTKIHILHWLLNIRPKLLQSVHAFEFAMLRRFLNTLPSDIKYRAILSLGPDRLWNIQDGWLKDLLYEYPKILEHVRESTIQQFFRKYKHWFMNYVKIRPAALDHISFVYEGRCYN